MNPRLIPEQVAYRLAEIERLAGVDLGRQTTGRSRRRTELRAAQAHAHAHADVDGLVVTKEDPHSRSSSPRAPRPRRGVLAGFGSVLIRMGIRLGGARPSALRAGS